MQTTIFLCFQGFIPVSSEIMSPEMRRNYDRPNSEKGDIPGQIFVCIQIRSVIYLHAICTACLKFALYL